MCIRDKIIIESRKEDEFAEQISDMELEKMAYYGITKISYYRRETIKSVSYTHLEAEIAFPQTLTVNLAGKTEPETLAVSWQTAEDYANSTYDTYIFTPVWDTSEYELAFENDMSPFIEVQITQGIEENLTNTINNTYSNVITLGTGGTYAN